MGDRWQFSVIPCIEESTFNKILERFYNFGISGLVRENIQNSLDGKLKGDISAHTNMGNVFNNSKESKDCNLKTKAEMGNVF